MAQNFKDCIEGQITAGAVSESAGRALLRKYDEAAESFISQGRTRDAAQAAAEQVLQKEARDIETRQREMIAHALRQKEINAYLESAPGKMEQKVETLYQTAAFQGERKRDTAYTFMNDAQETLAPDFFELKRDQQTFAEGLRVLSGGTSRVPGATEVAKVVSNTLEFLHNSIRAAGGRIDNPSPFPMVHSKEAIRKVELDEYVDFMMERVDRSKTIDETTGAPYTERRLREMWKKEYDSIKTSGRSDLAEFSKKGQAPPKGFEVEQRNSRSHLYQFNNFDAYLEYNNRFGTGENGLIQAFFGQVDKLSRELGILEVLGPKRDAMNRFLDFKMEASGTSKGKRSRINAQYKILASRFEEGDVDAAWYKGLTIVQNYQRFNFLASASISALSDTVWIAATAKTRGLDVTRQMVRYASALLPGSNETKTIAKRAGFVADIYNGSVHSDSRFAGEMDSRKMSGWLAGMTNKLSALAWLTNGGRMGVGVEGMGTLGDVIAAKTRWSDLTPELRGGLEQYRVNEADWNDLLKAKLIKEGHGKYLVTPDLRVDPTFTPARANELANKIDNWIADLRQRATNEPTLKTRAITTGAIFGEAGRGTLLRGISSSFWMFKSFPITVMHTHLFPAIARARVHRKFDHLAMATLGTTLVSALVVLPLQDLAKGLAPSEDMLSFEYLKKAALRAGGLGLLGDAVFGQYGKFGTNPIEQFFSALGPVTDLLADAGQLTVGNIHKALSGKDTRIKKDLFQIFKRYIPLRTLWYGKLLQERLLLDNLERLIDPASDRRKRNLIRRYKKENEQDFYWAPGQTTPRF